jgi:hypothetical protein
VKRPLYRRAVALLLALLPLAAGEALADNKETLDAARAAYYSLRREGLTSFSCLVTPNWDLLLASRWRADPAAAAKAYKTFSGLTFGVEVAPGQHPKVLHADVPSGEPESEALKRLVTGMEQTVSGFFETWTPFVLTTPIPGATAEVTQTHGVWIVGYKEGATQIGLVMRDDYTIESTRIVTATFASVIQPQFTKSPKGMLLTAVQGSFRKLSGDAAPVSLQLRIEYQNVSGFLLPKRLHVMSYDGRTVGVMDLGFGTCQAQHR